MGQNKLKILTFKILANFLILAAVIAVFYFIGQTHQSPPAQAAEQPQCGAVVETCFIGVPELPSKWYESGRCQFWKCWAGSNSVDCCAAKCGDGNISSGEDCDGSNLNGQTCVTQGYDGGTLKCYNNCLFDESACTYNAVCGNNKLENGEGCDGTAYDVVRYDKNGDGTVDCRDWGFTGGTLTCTRCSADTSQCSGGLGFCGNGVIETGEQCDGLNLGLPPATCSTLGCGTGTLKCTSSCTFDKTTCSDPTCGASSGCENKSTSDWSGYKQFTKSCCGDADGEIMDSEPSDADLCSGGGTIPTVRRIIDSQGNVSRWTWSCGAAICTAYAKAHCATSLSEETTTGSDCSPGKIFQNEAEFNTAVTANGGKKCTIGAYSLGGNCGNSGWNPTFNKEWLCSGAAPAGKENIARCLVGWAPASKCGTEDSDGLHLKKYPAGADCSQSAFWQVENKQATPDLCANGNELVPASKQYKPTEWPFDRNPSNRQFTWQCRSIFGPRRGEAVPCAVNLTGNCVSSEGKCGNDASGHYSVPPTKVPGQSLCLLGQSSDLRFDAGTWSWRWVCTAGGKNTDCSVTAEAVCGPADKGDYASEAEVRAAGPCAKGNLTANRIYDRGAQWDWTCESPADPKVYVVCHASTIKCGHAGDRAFLTTTFDAKQGNDGFLCASGTTAQGLSGPTYNDNFRRSDWTWKCGSRDCHATKLECGFGDNGAYHLVDDFNAKRQAWSSFLCSGGVAASFTETNSGWSWGCAGADGDVVSGCTANKYRCGDLNGQSTTWEKFYELFGTSGPCGGQGAISDVLCPEAVAVCVSGPYPYWICQTREGKRIDSCSANIMTCGTANNNWYYQSTLDNNKGKDNGFLCSKGAANGTINYSKDGNNIINRADWACNGFGGSTINCGAGVINCGSGNGKTYSDADSFYNACSRSDSSTCLCTKGNTSSDPRLPIFGFAGADWECSGDPSYHLGCSADAQGGGQ
jgi:hypothetical protein